MMFEEEEHLPEGISFYEPDLFEDEKIKVYPVAININDIYRNNQHVQNVVGLYFQLLSMFFLSNYKLVSREYVADLMEKLDWDYLLSLPYPAPEEEQGYVHNYSGEQ